VEFGAQVIVIKKASKEYREEQDPPPCPSVMVNGRFIARNDAVSYEELRTALLRCSDAE
jgi:hypothetical protein